MPMFAELRHFFRAIRDSKHGFHQSLAVINLCRALPLQIGSDDLIHVPRRVVKAVEELFNSIQAKTSEENPRTLRLYCVLKGIGGCKDSDAATWAADTKRGRRFEVLKAKSAKQQELLSKTKQKGVTVEFDVVIREDIWKQENQRICPLLRSPDDELDRLLWLVNRWWIKQETGRELITLRPFFYERTELFESKLKFQQHDHKIYPREDKVGSARAFVVYIDRDTAMWLPELERSFGNVCHIADQPQGSYVLKDANGLLRGSIHLDKALGEELKLHSSVERWKVVDAAGEERTFTWMQLLDHWDGMPDSASRTKLVVTRAIDRPAPLPTSNITENTRSKVLRSIWKGKHPCHWGCLHLQNPYHFIEEEPPQLSLVDQGNEFSHYITDKWNARDARTGSTTRQKSLIYNFEPSGSHAHEKLKTRH
ncbi:hypothetical protein B0H11DRAFT_1905050 [Mycena galericulata]|nr:hypothetical protein B0H11DRAFT_1905050 [Mycena galericulata]